jgi:hypothetical protein
MITITRTYMDHSGGTKFYQPFLIAYDGDDGLRSHATVLHWGPVSAKGSGRNGRPVLGGQVQVCQGSGIYRDRIASKQVGNSGGRYSVTHAEETAFSPAEGRAELIRLFGARRTEQILLELGLKFDGTEPPPGTRSDTKDSAPPAKPAAWGSW